MIQVRGVIKSFGQKEVLKGLNLDVPTGSTTCIIGKSGCGKSVLLKHIVGLLKADSGSISVDGKDINTIEHDEMFALRRRFGYVFQGAALFDSLTVYENVIIGLVENGEKNLALLDSEARRVLSSVGLLPDHSKNGTDEFEMEYRILSNKKPSDLSGGMRKRVGVARALVGSPDYIFYDEPTTGLDPVNSEQIDNLVGELAKKLKVTSVVITHDMFSVFHVADHVVMIDDGVALFQGSVQELRRSNEAAVVDFLSRYVAAGF